MDQFNLFVCKVPCAERSKLNFDSLRFIFIAFDENNLFNHSLTHLNLEAPQGTTRFASVCAKDRLLPCAKDKHMPSAWMNIKRECWLLVRECISAKQTFSGKRTHQCRSTSVSGLRRRKPRWNVYSDRNIKEISIENGSFYVANCSISEMVGRIVR